MTNPPSPRTSPHVVAPAFKIALIQFQAKVSEIAHTRPRLQGERNQNGSSDGSLLTFPSTSLFLQRRISPRQLPIFDRPPRREANSQYFRNITSRHGSQSAQTSPHPVLNLWRTCPDTKHSPESSISILCPALLSSRSNMYGPPRRERQLTVRQRLQTHWLPSCAT